MNWSPQQDAAVSSTVAWAIADGGPQVRRLFGFAGTGKTTIAREIAARVVGDRADARVLFAAFTGKAALVLRTKGCDGATTIHSLIYRPKKGEPGGRPVFELAADSPVRDAALVVIDECSMVGPDLGADLLSFGTKVLVLGDPAQLPPVKGSGYFVDGRPDVMLTEIHRQASENPIIRLATDVREGRALRLGTYGDSRVIRRGDVVRRDALGVDQVLVGMNRTRHEMNRRIRDLLGFTGTMPAEGDRLVCLRNNKEKGLLNGGLWDVVEARRGERTALLTIRSVDEPAKPLPVDVSVPYEFFQGDDGAVKRLNPRFRYENDEFDFGRALTVHKSQGSQWDSLTLFDESGAFREDAAKHLYTGLTRAAERITVVAA
jgi:exodeoxyribonuclease-5